MGRVLFSQFFPAPWQRKDRHGAELIDCEKISPQSSAKGRPRGLVRGPDPNLTMGKAWVWDSFCPLTKLSFL